LRRIGSAQQALNGSDGVGDVDDAMAVQLFGFEMLLTEGSR
jgi:hypothetical protein